MRSRIVCRATALAAVRDVSHRCGCLARHNTFHFDAALARLHVAADRATYINAAFTCF